MPLLDCDVGVDGRLALHSTEDALLDYDVGDVAEGAGVRTG